MNAFAAKLMNAAAGRTSRLYRIAISALRKHNLSEVAATRSLAMEVQGDLSLIRELCGQDLHDLIARKAKEYISDRALDMSGEPLRSGDGRRPGARDSQSIIAIPTPQINREAPRQSQLAHQGQAISAPALRETNWTKADIQPAERDREEAGLKDSAQAGQEQGAQPSRETNSSGEGLTSGAQTADIGVPSSLSAPITGRGLSISAQSQGGFAPSSDRFKPGHARRGADAIAAVQATMARSLLDTFMVRGGRPIGDLMLRELPDLVATNKKEAMILERVKNHAANGAPHQLVREIISDLSLETFIKDAEEQHAAK